MVVFIKIIQIVLFVLFFITTGFFMFCIIKILNQKGYKTSFFWKEPGFIFNFLKIIKQEKIEEKKLKMV